MCCCVLYLCLLSVIIYWERLLLLSVQPVGWNIFTKDYRLVKYLHSLCFCITNITAISFYCSGGWYWITAVNLHSFSRPIALQGLVLSFGTLAHLCLCARLTKLHSFARSRTRLPFLTRQSFLLFIHFS